MNSTKSIKDKAQDVLNKYEIKEPPVNVFDIAREEKIKILYFEPSARTKEILAGFDKKDQVIYLNSELPPEDQTFIIAHEFGHHFLGHDPARYTVIKDGAGFWENLVNKDKNSAIELEANIFAVELLLPEKLIKKVQKEYHLSSDDVFPIKRLFGIPRPVVMARMKV